MEITITIPQDVVRKLRAGDNLHLRLAVEKPEPRATPAAPSPTPQGPLGPLLARGDLVAGETLHWNRPRLKVRHEAAVLATGELEFDGRRYGSPSDAASAAAGSQANGWTAWHRSDGTPIDKLRQS